MLELIFDLTIGWVINLIILILSSLGASIRFILWALIGKKKTFAELIDKNYIIWNVVIGFIFLVLIILGVGYLFT